MRRRKTEGQFTKFLDIALGSAFEVETQLLISKNVGYINNDVYDDLIDKLTSIERQLSGLIKTIRQS